MSIAPGHYPPMAINGRELFEYLQCRFNMTEEQALASMREHNQDLSFLDEGADDEA